MPEPCNTAARVYYDVVHRRQLYSTHNLHDAHIWTTEKLRIRLEYSVDELIRKLCNNRGIIIIVNIDSIQSLVARNKVRKIDNKRTERNECQLILLSDVGSNDK